MRRLVVTGFGPFPRMPRNPSAEVALALAGAPRLRLHEIEARAAILTTAYATLPAELDPLLAEDPHVLLLIGVAGRSARIRIETRATARRSMLFPDVSGSIPGSLRSKFGPPSRRTDINAGKVLRQFRARGLQARLSRDAGRYLCNAAYLRALGRPGPTLFIHIPKVPRNRPPGGKRRLIGAHWRQAANRALVDVAIDLARRVGPR